MYHVDLIKWLQKLFDICVCVCVCMRETERERERQQFLVYADKEFIEA